MPQNEDKFVTAMRIIGLIAFLIFITLVGNRV